MPQGYSGGAQPVRIVNPGAVTLIPTTAPVETKILKASPGKLIALVVTNMSVSRRFLFILDAVAPTTGVVTNTLIPPLSLTGLSTTIFDFSSIPLIGATGITAVASTGSLSGADYSITAVGGADLGISAYIQ